MEYELQSGSCVISWFMICSVELSFLRNEPDFVSLELYFLCARFIDVTPPSRPCISAKYAIPNIFYKHNGILPLAFPSHLPFPRLYQFVYF